MKLVVVWMISNSIESRIVKQSNKSQSSIDGAHHEMDVNTHRDPVEEDRLKRKSDFDRGYDEFLRNYHNDNDVERHGRYRVQESDESVSNESDETSESVEDSVGSESEESEETRVKSKPQSKSSNGKQKIKNTEPTAKKKNKHCKMEKRKNMLCTICYDPKDDEKTESCSYNSEPKDHNYAYSEDSSTGYGTKDREPESLEGRGSNEFDESEGRRKAPRSKKPQLNKFNRYPVYRQPQQPRFYPTYSIRPFSNQNYGPQTFVPHAFQPLPGMRGKPVRLQMNGPPPGVTVIRYRTSEPSFSSQRIRVITYPTQPNHQNQSPKHHRPLTSSAEMRPPRDINGAQSESLLSNVTKDHLIEYLPSHLSNEASRKYLRFTKKGGPKCRKSIENNKMCFECYVEGERRKECMFTSKPKHFFESFSKSKKSNTKNPHTFDNLPESKSKYSQSSNEPELHHTKRNKNKVDGKQRLENSDRFNADMKTIISNERKLPNLPDKLSYSSNDRNPPKFQPPRAVPDVIYGTTRSQAEPLALLYQTDLTFGSNDTHSY